MNTNSNESFISSDKPKLRLVELCSGIGAQYKGLKNIGLFDVESVATSDLDKEVVVSYAAIHCGLTPEMVENYEDYPSKEEMIKELSDKRLGFDFTKDKPYDWAKLAKRKDKLKGIEKYWLADKISKNLGDMEKIAELPDCDFLTYSTPCQAFSIAGKQEGTTWTCQDCGHQYDPATLSVEDRYTCPVCGGEHIKSTTSGLLYEVERLLVKAKDNGNLPKYLLMENVDALVSKKFIDSFEDWVRRLDNLGYVSYYKVLNAKECGVPQNRRRIFVLSIRKDVDTGKYTFPIPFDNGLRLKDMLEDEVDEKWYLSDEIQMRLQITDETFTKNIVGTTKPDFRTIGQRDLVYQKNANYIGTLVSSDFKQPKQILEDSNKPIHIADMDSEKFRRMHDQSRRVYSEEGVAPAMHTCGGGNLEPKVLVPQATKAGVIECEVGGVADLSYPNSKTRRGRVQDNGQTSPTITATETGICRLEMDNNRQLRVRKILPLEAHRLMGFSDEDYYACENMGMSATQGFKQSGNSIVVNCIELITQHLYKALFDNNYICFDENFTKPLV